MCTLILWYRAFDDLPLLVAANRDELLDRPSAPPGIRELSQRRVLCPTDLQAGGTWLGVNDRRLFAAVTNRAWNEKHPERRSRGGLVLEALNHDDANSAAKAIAARDPTRENAFHLVIADADSAHLLLCDGKSIARRRLVPGLHVITERSFGGQVAVRETSIRSRIGVRAEPPDDAFLANLLSSHSRDDFQGLCIHVGNYGTRSSTLLRMGKDLRFQFADGPPHTTPYREVDTLP